MSSHGPHSRRAKTTAVLPPTRTRRHAHRILSRRRVVVEIGEEVQNQALPFQRTLRALAVPCGHARLQWAEVELAAERLADLREWREWRAVL